MAKAKKSKKSSGGRGSAEAIEKRKVARQLNAVLSGESKKARLDGRTEKRRQRLIDELKEGKGGKPLKPIEVVDHTNQLLEIGETIATLRKQGVKPRKTDADGIRDVIERAQKAYGFHPDAWRMLGVKLAAEGAPKKSAKKPAKRTAKKKRAKK